MQNDNLNDQAPEPTPATTAVDPVANEKVAESALNDQPAQPVIVEQPVPAETQEKVKKIKKLPRQRHFLIAFFFSFMWGTFGVDRMYMGYYGLGILKLITFGGFGIWALVDFVFISSGFMKDKQGREMLQAAEYKKFAGRTVLWFAICLGIFILINGLVAIYTIFNLITQFQNGGTGGLLNSLGVSTDQLKSAGVDPSSLGL